jgi:hypothetical protein
MSIIKKDYEYILNFFESDHLNEISYGEWVLRKRQYSFMSNKLCLERRSMPSFLVLLCLAVHFVASKSERDPEDLPSPIPTKKFIWLMQAKEAVDLSFLRSEQSDAIQVRRLPVFVGKRCLADSCGDTGCLGQRRATS